MLRHYIHFDASSAFQSRLEDELASRSLTYNMASSSEREPITMISLIIESCEDKDCLVKRIEEARRKHGPSAFLVVFHPAAIEDPELRWACVRECQMMTFNFSHLIEALTLVLSQVGSNEGHECPICGASHLSANDLWTHLPLYHINAPNVRGACPICSADHDNLAVHIHTEHSPNGKIIEHFPGVGSCVVVHRRSDDKFLMVQEFAGQGFWVPGGSIDPGESLRRCATRECEEEAGVKVKLRGLLEVMMDLSAFPPTGWRLLVFYATLLEDEEEQRDNDEAKDQVVKLEISRAMDAKTVPCYESGGTCWVTAAEVKAGQFKLRSNHVPCTWFEKLTSLGSGPVPLLSIPPLSLSTNDEVFFKDVEF
jgi:ADP-ribose pyrophosphatase YjhB (NUDIX family)